MNNISIESFINFCDDMIIAEEVDNDLKLYGGMIAATGVIAAGRAIKKRHDEKKNKKMVTDTTKNKKVEDDKKRLENAIEFERFKENLQLYKTEYNTLIRNFANAAKKVKSDNDKYIKPYGKFRNKLTDNGVSVFMLNTFDMCEKEYSDDYLGEKNFPFTSVHDLQNDAADYLDKVASCVENTEHFVITDEYDNYGESEIIIKFKRGVKSNNKLINPMKFIC